MDLEKAFDYITHDILIAKMEAYGFSGNFLNFFLIIPEVSRTIRKHWQYPHHVSNSSLQCPKRVHYGTIALQQFYKRPVFFFVKDAQLLNFTDGKEL